MSVTYVSQPPHFFIFLIFFTHVLSLAGLTTFQYYGYILLYVFTFMLDELVIFSTATFALTSSLGDRYAKYSRPVDAAILILWGYCSSAAFTLLIPSFYKAYVAYCGRLVGVAGYGFCGPSAQQACAQLKYANHP